MCSSKWIIPNLPLSKTMGNYKHDNASKHNNNTNDIDNNIRVNISYINIISFEEDLTQFS